MNILVITQMYSQPDDAGVNRPTKTVNYFAKEWNGMGHSVKVIHCPSKFPYIYYLVPAKIKNRFTNKRSTMTPPIESRRNLHHNEDGVDVYRLPMLKYYPGQPFSKRTMKIFANKIQRIIENDHFKPDVVVGHFANPSAELVSLIAQKNKAKSSIVFHHDCSPQKIEKYHLRQCCKTIGAIGARSITEAKEIQNDLKLPELPFVCYSGVPNEVIPLAEKVCLKHDYSSGTKYITVSSFIPRKHVDTVIRAFSRIASPLDTLLLVGGGLEESRLKELAKVLNVENQVVFSGRVPREQVMQLLKESHVFTLISDDETFGMAYIEAMIHGCLTIASRKGGFDGIITNMKNGFICNPGDEEELVEIYSKIKEMTINDRNAVGQNAINTAIHFSEREVAEKYLKELLDRNSQ